MKQKTNLFEKLVWFTKPNKKKKEEKKISNEHIPNYTTLEEMNLKEESEEDIKRKKKQKLVKLSEITTESSREMVSLLFGDDPDLVVDLNDPQYKKLFKLLNNNKDFHERLDQKLAESEFPQDDEPITEEELVDTPDEFEKQEEVDIFDESVDDTDIAIIKNLDDYIIKDFYNDEALIMDPDKVAENLHDAEKEFGEEEFKQAKLIILTMLYIGNLITPEQLFKSCKTQDDLIMCNSMIKFYSGIVVLTGVSIYGINEVVDLNLLEKVVKWEMKYSDKFDELEGILNISYMTSDLITEYRKKEMEAHGEQNPDPIKPFFFTNNMNFNPESPARGIRLDKTNLVKVERYFTESLGGLQHEFTREYNNYNIGWLRIFDNTRDDYYMVEYGSMKGNGPNIILPSPAGNIYVNHSKKSILKKLFAQPGYQLTNEEFISLRSNEFTNSNIYRIIDMTKGQEIFRNMSKADFIKLGKKLSFIINWKYSPNIPMCRLRFEIFKSVDDFVLVSDEKCVCPIPEDCYNYIAPGIKFKVQGDTVSVQNAAGYCEMETINNYNIM